MVAGLEGRLQEKGSKKAGRWDVLRVSPLNLGMDGEGVGSIFCLFAAFPLILYGCNLSRDA
jgi:hypothetical protein